MCTCVHVDIPRFLSLAWSLDTSAAQPADALVHYEQTVREECAALPAGGLPRGRGSRREPPHQGAAVTVEIRVEPGVESAWLQPLKLKYDELLSIFAFDFELRPYATAPRRAVRPYVVKLTTPSTYSALGVRGLASTSTLGNVHVQLAEGGRALPKHFLPPDCYYYIAVYRHTLTASMRSLF